MIRRMPKPKCMVMPLCNPYQQVDHIIHSETEKPSGGLSQIAARIPATSLPMYRKQTFTNLAQILATVTSWALTGLLSSHQWTLCLSCCWRSLEIHPFVWGNPVLLSFKLMYTLRIYTPLDSPRGQLPTFSTFVFELAPMEFVLSSATRCKVFLPRPSKEDDYNNDSSSLPTLVQWHQME